MIRLLKNHAKSKKAEKWVLPIAIFIIILLVLIGSLQNAYTISLDSGSYMEIGAGILHGKMPYVNFWDHKPPGTYYLNALAFWLMPTSPGVVHVLEAVWNLVASVTFYPMSRKTPCFSCGDISDSFLSERLS